MAEPPRAGKRGDYDLLFESKEKVYLKLSVNLVFYSGNYDKKFMPDMW